MYLQCVGGGIIWSPADFVHLSNDKEMMSIILMVGLFKQWDIE